MDQFENQGLNPRKNTTVFFKHIYFLDSVHKVRLIREYTVPTVP